MPVKKYRYFFYVVLILLVVALELRGSYLLSILNIANKWTEGFISILISTLIWGLFALIGMECVYNSSNATNQKEKLNQRKKEQILRGKKQEKKRRKRNRKQNKKNS